MNVPARRPVVGLLGLVTVTAVLFGLVPSSAAAAPAVRVVGLQTEAQAAPLGIDVQRPRLTWRVQASRRAVMQTAYRVRVSSTRERAAAGRADVWDSGRVATNRPSAD